MDKHDCSRIHLYDANHERFIRMKTILPSWFGNVVKFMFLFTLKIIV